MGTISVCRMIARRRSQVLAGTLGLGAAVVLTGAGLTAAPPSGVTDDVLQRPSSSPLGRLAYQHDDGTIVAGGQTFQSWRDYLLSDTFKDNGGRCGHVSRPNNIGGGSGSDCTYTFTNPDGIYDPSVILYRIPVVVHVIRNSSGTQGNISEAMVQSQIDILNEDFLALLGTPGQNGTDIQIEFYLATTDPGGNPTNGITYSNNTTWFNDGGSYWNSLAWDTNRYMNIYTNTASGALGYVPDLPQGGIAGSNEDRIVVLWSAFGRDAPIGPPFDQGRTATHEVGHYLGLEHTFTGGCGTSSCYTTGDLICDTNAQSSPTTGCSGTSCGSPDPIHNYMDYSDDTCMEEFTPEQARRMRCSLEHYRPLLAEIGDPPDGACCVAGSECPADFDGSGSVAAPDLLSLLAAWGPCPGCPQDIDGSGTVDSVDLLALLSAYGPCEDGSSCSVMSSADCTKAGGVFLGPNTNCEFVPCSSVMGACCAGDGSCSDLTEFECAAAGGTWESDTSCGKHQCPLPTGACCHPDESCTVETSADCASAGGTYSGDGVACTPGLCDLGPCGDPGSGSCFVANGTPGCDDADCCQTICGIDPFCCDTEWDQICVDEANQFCN